MGLPRTILFLLGAFKKGLFPRLQRQLRAQTVRPHVFSIYTAVFRAGIPCTHEKILIFTSAPVMIASVVQLDMHSECPLLSPGTVQSLKPMAWNQTRTCQLTSLEPHRQ